MSEFLGDRRRALEESFFAQRDRQLMDKLKQQVTKKQLAALSGIQNEATLDQLVESGMSAESLAALSLIPLIEVAWADGKMDPEERKAILSAADEKGIASGSASHGLLEEWLHNKPDSSMRSAWKAYVAALVEALEPAAAAELKVDVMGRARGVAQAAGGILGLGAISPSEQKALSDLESAFNPR